MIYNVEMTSHYLLLDYDWYFLWLGKMFICCRNMRNFLFGINIRVIIEWWTGEYHQFNLLKNK